MNNVNKSKVFVSIHCMAMSQIKRMYSLCWYVNALCACFHMFLFHCLVQKKEICANYFFDTENAGRENESEEMNDPMAIMISIIIIIKCILKLAICAFDIKFYLILLIRNYCSSWCRGEWNVDVFICLMEIKVYSNWFCVPFIS